MSKRKVELELIDATDLISTDESGVKFDELLRRILSTCATAEHYLIVPEENSSGCCCFTSTDGVVDTEELSEELRNQLRRFVKVSDKYLRLMSLLLKSRAFYQTYPSIKSDIPDDASLPVVDLPRTEEGRPYIPVAKGSLPDTSFSISHQHPYIGIARAPSDVKVGLDIVTFDTVNQNLYRNEMEFIDVFRLNFTKSEWDSIVDHEGDDMLNEFYLRWAIKEAYTKAQGRGMSLEFDSFETTLYDEDGIAIASIWNHAIMHISATGTRLSARIFHNENDQAEHWDFCFCFFGFASASASINAGKKQGCACVCIPASDKEGGLAMNCQWLEANYILTWHLSGDYHNYYY
jgi:4'-phosphopantetheinyl transferase